MVRAARQSSPKQLEASFVMRLYAVRLRDVVLAASNGDHSIRVLVLCVHGNALGGAWQGYHTHAAGKHESFDEFLDLNS